MCTRLRRLFFRQRKKIVSNIFMNKPPHPHTPTGTTPFDPQSYSSLSTQPDIKYKLMPDPLSVYVPLDSLTEETIDSLVSTALRSEKRQWHNSTCTILAFLLAINNKVSEIEKNNDSNNKFDEQTVQQATKVRQLLVEKDQSGDIRELHWDELRTIYKKMINENDNKLANNSGVQITRPYEELIIEGVHPDIIRSREYMARFRNHGWAPEELKVYWNANQLENLCPKHETNDKLVHEKTELEADDASKDETKSNQIKEESQTTVEETNEAKNKQTSVAEEEKTNHEDANEVKDISAITSDETNEVKNKQTAAEEETEHEVANEIKNKLTITSDETKVEETNIVKTNDQNRLSHDPSDADAVLALRQYPVSKRNHAGKITYVNKGIEQAVFDAPEDAQLIVLNFANERSPGGGYLRHAWAQEEIILFNSDGYRSLLDLKYGRMGGGYAIPEFGLAYVRDIRFFDRKTDKIRKADMLVSACYCLSGSPQLYDNPTSEGEWITNNVAKFRAFMAAAVANTKGDGSNTYLLLGPIGTGAFGNDVTQIGHVFHEVLSSKMMGSTGPVSKTFGNIWFVSTDKWKNDRFEKILSDHDSTETE